MSEPTNRHGLPSLMTVKAGRYYYLQPKVGGGRKWVSLSKNLDEALLQHKALSGMGIVSVKDLAPIAPKHALVGALRRTYDAAKARSKTKGAIYFTLTFDDVFELATRQNWRCAVTGLRFHDEKVEGAHARPYMASIDRIKCSHGYNKSNIRLVCIAVNLALSTYGEAVFGVLARAYVAQHVVRKNGPGKKSAKLSN